MDVACGPPVLQGEMGTIELYRRTTIGNCLTAALDELVSDGMLPPELAIKVLVQYDKVCQIWMPL
jgi:hypothetical protein